MNELSVDEVYAKALEVLEEKLPRTTLKILLIRLDRIGDVVLSLPAVDAVRRHFPMASISMMVRPYTKEIVEGYPGIDEVLVYDYGKTGRHHSLLGNARMLTELIDRRFDIAFILNPSVRSQLLPFVAGIPYRVGFESKLSFLLTHSAPDLRHEGKKQESEYTLDIVRAFGVQVDPQKQSRLEVRRDEEQFFDGILKDKKIVAIHAGASCPSKRWPKERFAELCRRLMEAGSHELVIVGGESEKELGDFLNANGVRAHDFCGKLNLKQLAALLKKSELLISNDSGPVHIASAVGTRTLTIFGRNLEGLSPERWKARGTGHAVLRKEVGCVVCLAHRCTIDFECLKALDVNEVFEKAQEMLACGQEPALR